MKTMNIRPNYKSSGGGNIVPVLILFAFFSAVTILILKFNPLVAPVAIFLGALYARINVRKSAAGAGISLVSGIVLLFLNDLARLDCADSCDAQTESSLGVIIILFLVFNLVLFLVMMNARSKQVN